MDKDSRLKSIIYINTYYTYDNSDNLVSMNLNGEEYYYTRNAQGDIIGLFDKTGTQVVNYTYDSWGKLISIDGTLKDTVGVKNPYRYRGYRYDNETGLYYLQSRYYSADWGRFVNADEPAILEYCQGNLLKANMFSYCTNNPVNKIDPNGYWGNGWWNRRETVARIINIGILIYTGINGYLMVKEVRRNLRYWRNLLVKEVTPYIVSYFGSNASKFFALAFNIILEAFGTSVGEMIAYAIDYYVDGRFGLSTRNGYCFG